MISQNKKGKQQGFTLIEVLIASFILIIVVSTMTYVYRTAILSSMVAEKQVKLASVVPVVVENIKFEMRQSVPNEAKQGSGELNGVRYEWYSELQKKGSSPPTYGENSPGLKQKTRFFLWKVFLKVSFKEKFKSYQFQEVTWTN